MTDTILGIKNEVDSILTKESRAVSVMSKEEITDRFLDSIIDLRKSLKASTDGLVKVDELISKVTWLEGMGAEEEETLTDLIDGGLQAHRVMLLNYVKLKRAFWRENIAKKEIAAFKEALDNFEESLFELDQIFFELRKDNGFNELVGSIA
jgi:hypothetical protein